MPQLLRQNQRQDRAATARSAGPALRRAQNHMSRPRVGLLFSHDWDALGFAQQAAAFQFDEAGFDLFSFPSNARLIGFDLQRFAAAQARRARARGW